MKSKSEIYEMGMLMDFYGTLLTDNTLEVMEMYYSNDMTLAEIAESLNMSRQGAHSFITKGKQQLLDYERKLGMFKRFRELRDQLEDVQTGIASIDRTALPGYEAEMLDRMYDTVTDMISKL